MSASLSASLSFVSFALLNVKYLPPQGRTHDGGWKVISLMRNGVGKDATYVCSQGCHMWNKVVTTCSQKKPSILIIMSCNRISRHLPRPDISDSFQEIQNIMNVFQVLVTSLLLPGAISVGCNLLLFFMSMYGQWEDGESVHTCQVSLHHGFFNLGRIL